MCGIPGILYVDHGSDFNNSYLAQVASDLTLQIVHSTIASPQGRGKIERFFGTVTPNYCLSSPVLNRHVTAPTSTLADFDRALRHFIVDTHHRRRHSEIGTSPHERWLADRWLPRMPADLTELDLLLVYVAKPCIVHRDGIHFQGLRYLNPTPGRLRTRTCHHPLRLPRHHRNRVFHHGHFLCKAINPGYIGDTVTLKDIDADRPACQGEVSPVVHSNPA
ncbi:hypothetical protein [Rhodococcus sp. H29-C3]|uniref:hypothetical protein n=1 Tax=Rhodococcus sp. H29-C3 TaxID=3046307 RepID=UPI0024BBD3F2|nr:hypothetical protein [Rhodococcus sp. H29-C3]MDJ0361882.1 hypothetical protein [Rhodococcus sp. H29-C3]